MVQMCVNKCNVDDQTSLIFCAEYGRFQIMSYLLAQGANVNAVDKKGHNSSQIAHLRGHSKCVDLLLEHGADGSTLQGLTFGICRQAIKTDENVKLMKDYRRNSRYCEYPECSSNKDEKDLNACVRCKIVHYCCKEHQRLHWPEHKKKCKELIV